MKKLKIIAILILVLSVILRSILRVIQIVFTNQEAEISIIGFVVAEISILFFGWIAWWLPRIGGIVLIVVGLLSLGFIALNSTPNNPDFPLFISLLAGFVMYSLPLLIAGVIFIIGHYRNSVEKRVPRAGE